MICRLGNAMLHNGYRQLDFKHTILFITIFLFEMMKKMKHRKRLEQNILSRKFESLCYHYLLSPRTNFQWAMCFSYNVTSFQMFTFNVTQTWFNLDFYRSVDSNWLFYSETFWQANQRFVREWTKKDCISSINNDVTYDLQLIQKWLFLKIGTQSYNLNDSLAY